MTVELVDIGVNLTHRRFDGDRDAVIAGALAAGVSRMVVTGTCVASSRAAIALAGSGVSASCSRRPASTRTTPAMPRLPRPWRIGRAGPGPRGACHRGVRARL